jgi:hypothetical protein
MLSHQRFSGQLAREIKQVAVPLDINILNTDNRALIIQDIQPQKRFSDCFPLFIEHCMNLVTHLVMLGDRLEAAKMVDDVGEPGVVRSDHLELPRGACGTQVAHARLCKAFIDKFSNPVKKFTKKIIALKLRKNYAFRQKNSSWIERIETPRLTRQLLVLVSDQVK